MPSSLYFDGQNPVYIGNVEGDVYVHSRGGGYRPGVPAEFGDERPSAPVDPEQAKVDASTDSLVELLNRKMENSKLDMLTGMMKEYLIGAQFGVLVGESVLNDRIFDSRLQKMVESVDKARPIPPIPVKPPVASVVTIRFSSDQMTEREAGEMFLSAYKGEIDNLEGGATATEAGVVLSVAPGDLDTINAIIDKTLSNPDFDAIAIGVNATPSDISDGSGNVTADVAGVMAEQLAPVADITQEATLQLSEQYYPPGCGFSPYSDNGMGCCPEGFEYNSIGGCVELPYGRSGSGGGSGGDGSGGGGSGGGGSSGGGSSGQGSDYDSSDMEVAGWSANGNIIYRNTRNGNYYTNRAGGGYDRVADNNVWYR